MRAVVLSGTLMRRRTVLYDSLMLLDDRPCISAGRALPLSTLAMEPWLRLEPVGLDIRETHCSTVVVENVATNIA